MTRVCQWSKAPFCFAQARPDVPSGPNSALPATLQVRDPSVESTLVIFTDARARPRIPNHLLSLHHSVLYNPSVPPFAPAAPSTIQNGADRHGTTTGYTRVKNDIVTEHLYVQVHA